MKKVSVILPTHNSNKYINECILGHNLHEKVHKKNLQTILKNCMCNSKYRYVTFLSPETIY